MGEYYISIFGAIIIVITLVFLKRIENKFISKNIIKKVEIKYRKKENLNIEIQKWFENENLKVKIIEYILEKEKTQYEQEEVHAIYTVIKPGYVKLDKLIEGLRKNENIIYIKMLS